MPSNGPEYFHCEKPLIDQLTTMPEIAWRHVRGVRDEEFEPVDPQLSLRDSFDESVLESILRGKLRELNVDSDGEPWLDQDRISHAISALARGTASSNDLLAANEAATNVLLGGTSVPGLPGWNGGRAQPVRYIDWQHPERNDFLAVSQFRMNIPGTGGREYLVPDIVLFVNGIPLVVIECKKPIASDGALRSAINQLQRDANRDGSGRGSDRLFRTIQLTVATTMDDARLGTFTSRYKDYHRWRSPYPYTRIELAESLGLADPDALQPQEILTAIVLDPRRLLDVVHNFIVFRDVDAGGGQTIRVKIAPRHQQYRAVDKAVDRLLHGATKSQDGSQDRRGGIVWHTQGSGKSLTMVFLVRKMRATPGLDGFKVIVVTDRRDLETQLSRTAELIGEKVDTLGRASAIPAKLSQPGAGLFFVMIQKQQDTKAARQNSDTLDHDRSPGWGLINTSESILILVDEAHRSHGSKLHGNLMQSLPNAARIGFTGTPIIMNQRRLTSKTFGRTIDTYRLLEAEEDEAIVPILYEGRISTATVTESADLDTAMREEFPPMSDEDFEELTLRYAKAPDILSAPAMVKRKARDMLRHYVATTMVEGFKAQVVAYSRGIAVGYRDALIEARDALVAEAEQAGPGLAEKKQCLAEDGEFLTEREHVLLTAWQKLALLKGIDFVPVISGADDDPKSWKPWTNPTRQDNAIADFQKPFPGPEELSSESKPVAVLIVCSMLLTGFDAPIEQVMYLDRRMREAELLQAIARVNRPEERKAAGLVVDYAGVATFLREAMAAYAAEDVERVTTDFAAEVNRLEERRNALNVLFESRDVIPDATDLRSMEPAVSLLADERLRVEFIQALRKFLKTVNLIMPLDEARPYLPDLRKYSTIATAARYRYAEDRLFDPEEHGARVRQLINEHILATGIEQKIPPARITAPDFPEKVTRLPGARAQASAMEHALRCHIELHIGEDPVAYSALREHLQRVLDDYRDEFDRQAEELAKLVKDAADIEHGRQGGLPERLRGLSRLEHALYRLLTEPLPGGLIDDETCDQYIRVAIEVCNKAFHASTKPDFFHNRVAQDVLRTDLYRLLVRDPRLRSAAGITADALREVVLNQQHRREVRERHVV